VNEENSPLPVGADGCGAPALRLLGPDILPLAREHPDALHQGAVLNAQCVEIVAVAIDHENRGHIPAETVEGENSPVPGEPGVVHVPSSPHERDAGREVGLEHAGIDGGDAPEALAPLFRRERALALGGGRVEEPELEPLGIDAKDANHGIAGGRGTGRGEEAEVKAWFELSPGLIRGRSCGARPHLEEDDPAHEEGKKSISLLPHVGPHSAC